VAAVIELGRITATPTPMIDALYAAVLLLQRTLQAQQGRLRIESARQ
jgi:2-dehydropantoate 2-reductase